MAKKRQFKGAKYKDGILSYNYLGGKGGKGRGNVSIKQQGDDWYFVGKDGEIRTDVGDGGKLTPTHMKNLKNDGIFDAVPKAEVPDGPKGDVDPNPGDAKPPVELAESNYELPGEMSAPVSKAQKAFTPGDSAAGSSNPITASTENAPTFQSESYTGPGTSVWSPSAGELSVRGSSTQGNMPMNYSSGGDWSPGASSTSDGGFTSSNIAIPQSSGGSSEYVDKFGPGTPKQSSYGGSEWQDKNPRGYGSFNSDGPGYRYTKEGAEIPLRPPSTFGPPSSSPISTSPDTAFSPANEYTGVSADNTPNMPSDYTTGWSPGVESAGMPSEPGIKNQASPGMTSAEGWNAAGSVMKGVGGLASAYTGIKNYQLARDAHNAQKNQWQANYNQQLKAYEDNKVMANNEIAARNRVLESRGQKKSYNTIK